MRNHQPALECHDAVGAAGEVVVVGGDQRGGAFVLDQALEGFEDQAEAASGQIAVASIHRRSRDMREDIHPGKRADGEGAQGNKSGEVFNEVEHRGLPCFCVCSYMFDLCSRPGRNSGETGDTGKLVRNWLGEVPGALRFGTSRT